MQFTAVNSLLYKNTPLNIALEASGDYVTVDVEGQSMNISLITDKLIEENDLPEVSDPVLFKKGNVPTDNGLFSPIIFGDSPKEKRLNHAYINLKRKFFHPYVFETMLRLNRKLDIVARGESVWSISDTGKLVEIKNPDDPEYDEDNTGLAWLIDHFHEIQFTETKSSENQERIKLIKSLSDDEIFITKWVVIPIFYRDCDVSSGKRSIPPINSLYATIMQNAIALDTSIISIAKHATMYKIQKTLIDLRKHGQGLVEKKHGAFQKSILGKAADFGDRGVISVPSLNNCDVPNDCIVDITHSGIPLSFCINLGYPFMMKWIQEFFEDMFRNKRTIPAFRKNEEGEFVLEHVPIIDQTQVFTEEFIEKKMKMFRMTYGAERFETIKIKCEDGREAEVMFTGKGYATRPDDPRANTIGNRPLTWTDVFYLAAENTLSSKYCYITRYPLEDYFGTFPSKVAILSTIKTSPVIINGKVYPHYPVIDLSLPPNEVATQFIDTISISNLYLDAIGGDYDGDTVSIKILYSIEANQEAAQALEDIKHYVSIQGNLVRVIGNESYLSFYNMTRRDASNSKKLSDADKKELLSLEQDNLSISLMTKLFGKHTSKQAGVFKIEEPRFNIRDTFKLEAGEYTNKQEVETTVGSFIFNKLLVEGMLESIVPNGYYNDVINKKGFSKLVDSISEGLMMERIPVNPTLIKWLKQYEFYGMKACTIFSPSYSEGLLRRNTSVLKEKEKILKSKKIETTQDMSELEDNLVNSAREILSDDTGMTLFDSGARGSFDNDYKNMNLMLGPVAVPGSDGKFDMVTSNYIDGLQKEDLVACGNVVVNSAYPKAVGTQEGGYLTKQYYAAYQSIQCDDDGTDCGTKLGLDMILTENDVEDYLYQNIMTPKGPVVLTNDNKSQFIGKRVTIRSSMFCRSDKICSVCAGRRFYMMKIKNIGLTSGRVSNTLLNASMKNFHNAKVKFDEVNINDLLI